MNPLDLEKKIHSLFLPISDECLIGDNSIVKLFGNNAYGTDHFIKIGKYIITIQDKWEKTSPKLHAINHFIQSVNYITKQVSQELLLSLFVSKEKMTSRGQEILDNENEKYSSNIFVSLNNSNSMDDLAKNVYEYVVSKLKLTGICINKEINNDKWSLFDHQQKTVSTFTDKFLIDDSKLRSGIVCLPTGTGKTVIAMSMIGAFFNKFKNRAVLWLTKRKDVLQSQFDNGNNFDICINSGFIQNYDFFNLLTWYNSKTDIDKLNEKLNSDKPVFLIANIDTILYDNRYKNILKDKFGLIILDECHCASAQYTYDMLGYCKQEWNNLKCIVGFSATPIRTENSKFKRTAALFGDGTFVNFISKMTLIDAIDQDIIVPPNFRWVETNIDKDISFDNFMRNCGENEYSKIVDHIEELFAESFTKKGIAWTQTINNADNWKKVIERCQQNSEKYEQLSKLKIFISHTGNSIKENGNEIKKFTMYKKPCLMICVGRCREGFDDPMIDIGLNLDAVQTRGQIVFIQETGRTLRNYKDKKVGYMMDTFTFSDEENKMKQLVNILVGYCLFLHQFDSNSTDFNISRAYVEFVKRLTVSGKKIIITTPKGKTIEFNITSTTLKKMDWDKLPKTFIKMIEKEFYKNGIGFETAKSIIRESDPIPKNKEEYLLLCKSDLRLPEEPELVFKGQFIGWLDYLGIKGNFYDLHTCKEKVTFYLKNKPELKKYNLDISKISLELCKIDLLFPPYGLWCDYYKHNNIGDLSEIINVLKKKKKKTLADLLLN